MAQSCRESLISVATRLFYDLGFHAVGLDRILEEVGVTKTTFYKHFESKDDLIIAVLQERDAQETEEWMRTIRERAGPDARAQLLGFFDLLAEWFGRPEFRGCMFMKAVAEFPDPADPVHRTASQHGERLWAEMQRLAVESGAHDADRLASQLLMVLSGAIVAAHGSPNPLAAHLAKATATMLVDSSTPGTPAAAGGRR